MFKNVAASFIVFAFDTTTNAAKTGDAANITAYVSKDYGAVTVLADTTATEMDATNAPGCYLFAAAQGETNGDILMVSGKSSTANIAVIGAPAIIYTRPTTGWLAPTTAGRTLTADASGHVTLADGVSHGGTLGSSTATLALSRASVVSQSSNTDALTVTGNGTGDGAVFTSGAGATGDGMQITAGSTNGNGLKLTKTGTGVALAAPTTDIVLAKTTNITGFNDIAATAVVSSGAITTSGGAVTTVTTATNVTTVNGLAANVITAASMAADASAEIADAVWDEDATAHQTQGTFGQAIGDPGADTNTIFKAVVTDATGATVGVDVAAVLDDTGTAGVVVASIAANAITAAATAADFGAEIADAVWDEALAGHAGAGSAGEALAAAGTAGDPWTTALPGAYGAGTAGKIIGDNINATISSRAAASDLATVAGYLDTEIAAILADTNELQTDWVDGGRLDLLIDAIKAKSDLIPGTQDGLTFAQSMMLQNAVLLGKASGLGTTTAVYRSTDDGEDRVTATVDADGNRTAVTLNTV